MFERVARAYGDNEAHAFRLFGYMSRGWFMPATPVLSNGGAGRGYPISCFINETDDSLDGIRALWDENILLASGGGGLGSYWGNIRSIGEQVKGSGVTSGIIPFIKVMESMTLAISQGSLRRGSAAVYLPMSHPEIEEFLALRTPTGGDPYRKTLHLHHGVSVCDGFMRAVEQGSSWALTSPADGSVVREVGARELWAKLLNLRLKTGEPYILFTDTVNRLRPDVYKKLGLDVKTSNLCSEITLHTGKDHLGKRRTAVCCLGSLNLEHYLTWQREGAENFERITEDCLRMLDNVLEDYIARSQVPAAAYSAFRERSIGLGVMGLHSFFQSQRLPFGSASARAYNNKIFSELHGHAKRASAKLAAERGACPDAAEAGLQERFAHALAVAPTASISIICGECSPGIEPYYGNSYSQKTLSGTLALRNRYLDKRLSEALGGSEGLNEQLKEEVWSQITRAEGSVQELSCLTPEDKDVFRTAFEINQHDIINLAADRTPYICQAQSLNLFLPPETSPQELHNLHKSAYIKQVKSLYYLRSLAAKNPDAPERRINNTEDCSACG
jgi:ribonucleoside-diphosphate reductase alpha chain